MTLPPSLVSSPPPNLAGGRAPEQPGH